MKKIMCDMCSANAVALFAMSQGCVCKPEMREMHLCEQHVHKTEPVGSMTMICTVNGYTFNDLRSE